MFEQLSCCYIKDKHKISSLVAIYKDAHLIETDEPKAIGLARLYSYNYTAKV